MKKHTCDKCDILLIDLSTTHVCPICGRETLKQLEPSLGVQKWHDSALLYTHYSRLNRFIRLMDNVVLPSTSKKDENMNSYQPH